MIHELAEPIESATHVRVVQIQESWREDTRTIHLRVTFGTVEDGRFQPNPLLKSGEVRILPDEWEDFCRHQQENLDVPEDVADSGEWRRRDVCDYLDACGGDGWRRIF